MLAMSARRMLELLFPLVIACGDPVSEEQVGKAAAALDVTVPASDLGIDDAVFRRIDSHDVPVLSCPPDAPFVCRTDEGSFGWECSQLACPPPEDTLR
jgi:hypothetical protein